MINDARMQELAEIQLEMVIIKEYLELPSSVVMINRSYEDEESLREDVLNATGKVYDFLVVGINAEMNEESLQGQLDELTLLAAELEIDNKRLNLKFEKMKAAGKSKVKVKSSSVYPKFVASKDHKGVSIRHGKKGTKYVAKPYIDGKPRTIGTFDNELLAAAAVQEALGNMEEAQRLRDQASAGDDIEQLKDEVNGVNIDFWECDSCAADFGDNPPENRVCLKCNSGMVVKSQRREGN